MERKGRGRGGEQTRAETPQTKGGTVASTKPHLDGTVRHTKPSRQERVERRSRVEVRGSKGGAG